MPDINYIDKTKQQLPPGILSTIPPDNVLNGLLGVYIKSHIQHQSVVVIIGTEIKALILLSTLTGWVLNGNTIIIDGLVSVVLNFTSAAEAQAGEVRLTNALNGLLVV